MFKLLRSNNLSNRLYELQKCMTSNYTPSSGPVVFRTTETSPTNQSTNNLAQFYEVSKETKKRLFQYGGLPKKFEKQVKTFGECCFMVRDPALDIINNLKGVDNQKPVVRFVIYGRLGTGKSVTMAHVMHYCSENNFLIIHVPWVSNWMRRCKEFANSTTREGFVDLPIDSAAWLIHFRSQNTKLINELTITNDYVWSKRETTPKGAKLADLVEHGINRIKFASDCIVAIANEIKILSTAGQCKTLVAIDGFNGFFYPKTKIFTDSKVMVPPEKVTLSTAFLELTKNDWSNGAVVVIVDEQAVPEADQGSHYPFYLLGKKGFEHLDPFVPVHVGDYTDKEFHSCMKYYRDRLWVQAVGDPDAQNQELHFLSGTNPYKLMEICAPL